MYWRNVWSGQLPVLLMPLLVVVWVASPDLAFVAFSVDCARVRCCSSVGSVEAANAFKSGSFSVLPLVLVNLRRAFARRSPRAPASLAL